MLLYKPLRKREKTPLKAPGCSRFFPKNLHDLGLLPSRVSSPVTMWASVLLVDKTFPSRKLRNSTPWKRISVPRLKVEVKELLESLIPSSFGTDRGQQHWHIQEISLKRPPITRTNGANTGKSHKQRPNRNPKPRTERQFVFSEKEKLEVID